jgi:hypothetical protein
VPHITTRPTSTKWAFQTVAKRGRIPGIIANPRLYRMI